MVDEPLTHEQRVAVEAPGPVAVRAGAGSGKTKVLAERFVHLLRPRGNATEPPEVARLLAITFTEKAAAEMRGRIRALVMREGGANPEDSAHWATVQRDLLGAHISTIHAFCARIVREFPLQTGIDPDARVLDADEARRYLDARVEAHLLDLLGAAHTGARALVLRGRGLRGGRGGGAVGAMLSLLRSLARLGRTGEWLQQRTERARLSRSGDASAAACRELIASIDGLLASRSTKRLGEFAAEWPTWKARLEGLADSGGAEWQTAIELLGGLVARLKDLRLATQVADIVSISQGRVRGRLAEALASVAMGDEAAELVGLLLEVDARLRADKRRDGVLTFDDLVLGARDLVTANPSVRAALSRRFDAVLVDETQDTDPAQAELLRAITGGDGATLFVVGDEKQAIYGFRGADVGVFEALLRELPTRVTLGRNFRSVPGILGFVNAMAAGMLRAPTDAAHPELWTRYAPEHALTAHRAAASVTPAVRIVTAAHELLRRDMPKAAERRELEARILAAVVCDLLNDEGAGVRAGAVTILLRSLREVKVYERALARRGVPYHVVGGRGFFQRQEVRDLVSLGALVADAGDEVALASVLRSPWVGLSDDALWALASKSGSLRRGFEGRMSVDVGDTLARFDDVLGELRALRSRASVSEILVRAVEALDLDTVLLGLPQGDQLVANVRKVIELARAFERGIHGGLAEFVEWMRRREGADTDEPEATLASEEGDVVRLMTIHQAKGLEFPVVVLADLGREPRIDYDSMVVDEDAGMLAAPLLGAGGHPVAPTELVAHRARALEATHAEHARLFYVACTRARDRLILLDATTPPECLTGKRVKGTTWGHAVWGLLGDRIVLDAGAATESTTVSVAGDTMVQLEPASRWLGESAAAVSFADQGGDNAERREVETVVADVLDASVVPGLAVAECTPTEMATFRQCARRWWYQSVIGVREVGDGGRRARVVGGLVHAAIERWTNGVAENVDAALGASLAFRMPDPSGRAIVRADMERALTWLTAERAEGTRVVASELPFVLGLAPDVVLRGRIDAVIERDGALVVRDYKYARPPVHPDAAYGDQLALYALALARGGWAVDAAELVYLRESPKVVAVSLPALDDVVAVALRVAREIGACRADAGRNIPPRGLDGPAACREAGCGYVRRCWISGSDPDARARTAEA